MTYKFNDLISAQAEMIFSADKIDVEVMSTEIMEVEASYLQIPFLVNVGTTLSKLGVNSGSLGEVIIGAVGGFYFTVPLGDARVRIPLLDTSEDVEWTGSGGIIIGIYGGKKLGPGTLLFDLRYAGDFEDSKIEYGGSKLKAFKRSRAELGIGYLFQL